jgi:RNA polymerase sigma-70 factor (ECF subfamily)
VYAAGIRLLALRALGDASLADDIAQEAVTRAIAAIASGRGDSIADVGGFVYGIARHLIADVHRARGRTVELDAVPEPPAPAVNALDAAIAEEDRRRVRAALDELPPADRDLLRCFFLEGLRAEEVGERLGETPVNIRKRKSRALERLRRLFGHESADNATNTR